MSPDHLNKEGLAEIGEIQLSFSFIFLLSIVSIILHRIHLNAHFYIFGGFSYILFRIYDYWIIVKDALFYWYFLL